MDSAAWLRSHSPPEDTIGWAMHPVRVTGAHPPASPTLPPGEGSAPRAYPNEGPLAQARQNSNFSGEAPPRGFEDLWRDLTNDGLPAGNLQVSGGGQGQPQHPGGEFLEG